MHDSVVRVAYTRSHAKPVIARAPPGAARATVATSPNVEPCRVSRNTSRGQSGSAHGGASTGGAGLGRGSSRDPSAAHPLAVSTVSATIIVTSARRADLRMPDEL